MRCRRLEGRRPPQLFPRSAFSSFLCLLNGSSCAFSSRFLGVNPMSHVPCPMSHGPRPTAHGPRTTAHNLRPAFCLLLPVSSVQGPGVGSRVLVQSPESRAQVSGLGVPRLASSVLRPGSGVRGLGSSSRFGRPVSGVRCPVPAVRCPVSGVRRPASNVQRPTSRVRRPASGVRRPASSVQCPVSSVQGPRSKVQGPRSKVLRPGSRVQGPGSRVQGLASRVPRPADGCFMPCSTFRNDSVSGRVRSVRVSTLALGQPRGRRALFSAGPTVKGNFCKQRDARLVGPMCCAGIGCKDFAPQ